MCKREKAVLVHAGIDGMFGQLVTILPESSLRLRDIYGGVTLNQKESSALCSCSMVVGAIQTIEIINFILHGKKGLRFSNKIASIDLHSFSIEFIKLKR